MQIAAAAGCALAHLILAQPLHSETALGAAVTDAVAAALARPGLVLAMAECSNAEHAAGVLSVAALELTVVNAAAAALDAELAAKLAPALPAALAAPSNNRSDEMRSRLRRDAAAKLLAAVAQQPRLALAVAGLLPAAAGFHGRLGADVDEQLRRMLGSGRGGNTSSAEGTSRHGDAGMSGGSRSSSGSGSPSSSEPPSAADAEALAQLCGACGAAAAGTVALLNAVLVNPGEQRAAAAAADAVAGPAAGRCQSNSRTAGHGAAGAGSCQ